MLTASLGHRDDVAATLAGAIGVSRGWRASWLRPGNAPQ